jgi:hypothetical protein
MPAPVLPRTARLDVRRVRFLLKLRPLPGFYRTYCLFDSKGGDLRRHYRKGENDPSKSGGYSDRTASNTSPFIPSLGILGSETLPLPGVS